MTPGTTPAHEEGAALKHEAILFDSCLVMRTHELKQRIQRADYDVDPVLVAEAMLRHAVSQRRWWNPVADCSMPPAVSTTCGPPSTTDPIHVSGADACAAARSSGAKHTHSS